MSLVFLQLRLFNDFFKPIIIRVFCWSFLFYVLQHLSASLASFCLKAILMKKFLKEKKKSVKETRKKREIERIEREGESERERGGKEREKERGTLLAS